MQPLVAAAVEISDSAGEVLIHARAREREREIFSLSPPGERARETDCVRAHNFSCRSTREYWRVWYCLFLFLYTPSIVFTFASVTARIDVSRADAARSSVLIDFCLDGWCRLHRESCSRGFVDWNDDGWCGLSRAFEAHGLID